MKHTFRSRFWSFLTITSLVAATFSYVFAQDSTDEQTMLQAIEQTTPTPADEVPIDGQFHSAAHPEWPPLPGNIYGVPAWNLGDNVWLLDDLSIGTMSSMTLMSADDLTPPGDGDTNGYGGYTNNFVPFPLDTNSLWLEVTNVDNNGGIAYANLHMATNMVYAIWAATNLPGGWQVENEVWPTDTNCQPFTMQTLGRNLLFLKAEDWTGVDSDSDGVPDWWSWIYWGTPNVPDANLDYSGNGKTFSQDYSNNITPTVFSFAGIQVANNVVSSTTTPMQLDVTGYPYYVATVVDDTNFVADANWQLYTGSSITVSLGLTEGWHDVWVGLLGHGSDPTNAIWQWQRMKLDYTAPSLVITGPTNGTLTVPLVQITGYSPEALASINYDISNAVETITNQLAMITGQAYSTNTFEFTTNYFQCYDVPLASGLNAITIHATDLAGNVTTLVTNLTYSATTNPPVVSLIWPLSGMQISSDNITIQGHVDDPTANVIVATVDADGNTNSFSGLTGRDGVFWVENVPLSSGTNQLAITVSNSAGETTTNATLIQSAVGLTVNSVQAGDTMVTGTIGTNGYTIWVNGNQATNDGSGNWTAPIASVGVGGGQVAVTAIPNSDNGGSGSGSGDGVNPSSSQSINTQATVQSPQGTFISSYHKNYQNPYPFDAGAFWMIFGDVFWDYDNLNWDEGSGGTENTYYTGGFEITYPVYDNKIWPANNWPQSSPDGTWINLYWDYDQYNETMTVVTNQYGIGGPALAQEHCDMTGISPFSYESVRRTADTEVKLATGGPLGSKQMNLWCLTASATAYTNLYDTVGTNVPYTQIEIGGYGNLDTNGELWVVLPDNDPDVVTPHVPGKNKYTFGGGDDKHTLVLAFNGVNVRDSNSTVIVGQPISLTCGWDAGGGPTITNYSWTVPGTTFSNYVADANTGILYTDFPKTNSEADFYWADGGNKQVSCEITVMGKKITAQTSFRVLRPTAKVTAVTTSVNVDTFVNAFGFFATNSSDEGITLTCVMTVPSGFSGTNQWVQIVENPYRSLQDTNGVTWVLTETNAPPYLDTTYPYMNKYGPTGNVAKDSPSMSLSSSYPNMTMNNSFKMWLMFKPTGGQWVPLRTVNWNCGGSVSLSGGSWSLTNPSWSPNPPDADSGTTFPQWNSNVKNYIYQAQP